MDIRHFEYFAAVAREGNFSRAANHLQIAQPALSKQIRDLEAQLGGRLFNRTTRSVELTALGRAIFPEVELALAQFQRTKVVARQYVSGQAGSVRIGFTGNALLTEKVASGLLRFHTQNPNVSIELTELVASSQVEMVLTGHLDIGFQPGLGLERDDRLQVRMIDSWPWVLAIPTGHTLSKESGVRLVELCDENFIMYAAHAGDRSAALILKTLAGDASRIVCHTTSTMTVLGMVATGLGIALLPGILSVLGHPGVSYVPILDNVPPSDLVAIGRLSDDHGPVAALLATIE
jgi:DNA-binding transcriptional LysR family regulator